MSTPSGARRRGEFNVREFPGGHFYVQSERPLLLRALGELVAPLLVQRSGGTAHDGP